ncbi:hypothetical protein ACI2K4_32560 [Micromonospora sp. NPDC050397]|uniref:hypothetical protein n=1 Tax=Micromonospora sp. NPDC050397 TaxID=3364279 RepID=UPI00384D2DF5
MNIVRKALAMAVGLWASTVLPGIALTGGSAASRLGALAGATALFGALWLLTEGLAGLFRRGEGWLGQRVRVEVESSLGSPALAEVTVASSGTAGHGEADLVVPGLGGALWRATKTLVAVASLPLELWLTGWFAVRLGVGFRVEGFWTTIAGSAIAAGTYVLVGITLYRAVRRSAPAASSDA